MRWHSCTPSVLNSILHGCFIFNSQKILSHIKLPITNWPNWQLLLKIQVYKCRGILPITIYSKFQSIPSYHGKDILIQKCKNWSKNWTWKLDIHEHDQTLISFYWQPCFGHKIAYWKARFGLDLVVFFSNSPYSLISFKSVYYRMEGVLVNHHPYQYSILII